MNLSKSNLNTTINFYKLNNMEDIHKLTDCINLHFNSGVTIISHKNWKMLEYKQDLKKLFILLTA